MGRSRGRTTRRTALTTYGAVSYTYTANGDLLTATSGGRDDDLQLRRVRQSHRRDAAVGTQIAYVIDGQNRRIGKKVNGVLTQGFLYGSQLRPAAELDGSGAVVSRFVYGTRINVPDYMVKGGVTYRLLTDHLGSVRLVVNTTTGAIAQRIDYDEFGQVTQDTNPGFQPFGFAGGLYDPDTKLVRFGARDYDAFTGRWTTKDPIGFAGGRLSFYEYVGNRPLSRTDPFGLIEWPHDAPMPWNEGANLMPPLGLNGLVPTYGNWGGPGWSGGVAGGLVGPNPAVDSMDECFKAHDECYGERSCQRQPTTHRRMCDRSLVQCLSQLSDDPREWLNPAPHPEFAKDYRKAATRLFRLRSRW